MVGYYFSYALLLFVSSAKLAKQGQKGLALRRVRNLILFGVCAMAAMVVLLWPMVSKILAFNYSDRYSYYNVGGIAVELYYHAMRTGLLNLILILFGLWLCVKRKKPSLPVLALCELMLSMLLFTRVQNSGSHQMLLYVPAYIILFLCGAAGLAESIEHFKIPKLCFWVFTLLFAVSVRCSPLTVMALPEFVIHAFHPADLAEYQRLDELTYDRKDKPQIQAMAQWLVEHLGEGEVAYMIPDDMLYNPGHLRNCDLPNHALDGKLPDSFSVPGTHYFPTGFFDARYVVTADPFPLSLAPDTELGHRFFTLLFAVSVRCSPLTVMALPEFVIHAFHPADLAEYQRLDELTYDRKDKPQIQAMAQWLVEHLGEGEVAYMIPDDMLYNPGHLRNCDLPNHALDGKLPDSFSVPGTHYFPTGFFDARYVVTADPFPLSLAPDTELGHRFNAVFLQLRETTHQQVATFDMGNGTVFTIWERTTPVTREEVETYLHEFDAENAKYPEMFSSVVENWLAVHGL